MIIGGLQKVTLIDYPGKVAAIVFTRGCPLRCHYCQNPQLVLPERFGEQIDEERLMQFFESRKGKLDGIVVTGGEPLMHRDIAVFLKKLKQMGFAVKLDTCGAFPDALQSVIGKKLVDYIAMDLKAPFERYGEVTGTKVDVNNIKRSIKIIMESGLGYEFRTTVVKEQLSEDDLLGMSKSVQGASSYVLQKFRKCDTLDPAFRDEDTYSDDEFERIAGRIKANVKDCKVR